MTTVFIAGSISISNLHEKVQERISKIVSSDFNIVVGDADGADKSIQECLRAHRANNVTIFCTGDTPRNNVFDWPIRRVHSKARPGSRSYFTAKDLEMARSSDYGLMIWDCKSTGTLSNVLELLKEKKKSLVFVNKNKDFVTIADKMGLDLLLTFMSEHARAKAEEKIGLSEKLAQLNQEHLSFDTSGADQSPLISEARQEMQRHPKDTGNDPHPTENMKLRFALISALKEYIHRAHLSQSQAAKIFGVTQPRISDLAREKVDLFGLDALVNMAFTAGLRVEMSLRDNGSEA
ncbi:MAG TPA: XRE family transcriptional regulator [Acidobacteriaceae bacterium]